MSRKAGALLWSRQRITLGAGINDIDTGLMQVSKSFAGQSPNEPSLGVTAAIAPPNGTLPASRVHVIPLAPLARWTDITQGEPYFDSTTQTVHVQLTNNGKPGTEINVLFWNPHAIVGPGQADTYNPA